MPSSLDAADTDTSGGQRVRVVHVITGLGLGGAELVLLRLLESLDPSSYSSRVVSLTGKGELGERIRDLDIPLLTLDLRGASSFVPSIRRIREAIKLPEADVVQGWMYHGNLACLLGARKPPAPAIVWNLRTAAMDSLARRPGTWFVLILSALLSRLPRVVIANSSSGLQYHTRRGFRPREWALIENGVDTTIFRPDPVARRRARQSLGLPAEATIIGAVARFHPQKDHRTFVRAAGLLLRARPETHFLLCGAGLTWENHDLAVWIAEAGAVDRFHLLGPRYDMPDVMSAIDYFSLTSIGGEGFPNVVAEAMACGVPCIVTDVGDSAALVGDTGRVVPPGDPQALAAAWEDLLAAGPAVREQLGAAARRRIESEFSLPKMVSKYEELYLRLAQDRGAERLSQL